MAKASKFAVEARLPKGVVKTVSIRPFTAPVNGLDFRSPRISPDPKSALLLDNFICTNAGAEIRGGTFQWFNNLGGSVNSLMSYAFGGAPKLFAAVGDNVFDVTTKNVDSTPSAALTTAQALTNAGRWSHLNFVTAATGYLCCNALGAGYYTYDASGGWVNRNSAVTGVDLKTCDFVGMWKKSLMFVENNSTRIWYLAAGTITGAASSFDVGAQFPRGGYVSMIGSWTVDGGDGLDDVLVVVSTNGDVVLYTGTTGPASTDFQIKGRWYAGRVPIGRRHMIPYSGDMFVLCEGGFLPLSAILRGDPFANNTKASARVAAKIGSDVGASTTGTRWQVLFHPNADIILVNSGETSDVAVGKQWVLGTEKLAWSTFSGWKATAFEHHEGNLYYADADGVVRKALYGSYDDAKVSDHGGTESSGLACEARLQQAFIDVAQRRYVAFQQVRLIFSGEAQPGMEVSINPEFDYNSLPAPPVWIAASNSTWDSAIWDTDSWAADNNQSYSTIRGVLGRGTMASLLLRVKGPSGTVFNGWDLFYRVTGDQ